MKNHKTSLCRAIDGVILEMNDDLTYSTFRKSIEDQLNEARKNDELKTTEKRLITEIQNINLEHKKQQNEYAKEKEENDIEVSNLKKNVNETQVEKELHL